MCSKCESFGGQWCRGENGGVRRCDCSAGVALARIDSDRANGQVYSPVLSIDAALVGVEMLSGVCNYVPANGSPGRTLVAEEMRSMCRSQEDMLWLVKRMGQLYRDWPGTREMRIVYCSKARPLDGIELEGSSETYPDGIPSGALALHAPKRIAAPEDISAAASLRETVGTLAVAKNLNHIGTMRAQAVRSIPIRQHGGITQADIDAAVQRSREMIAKKELGL